MTIKVVLEGMGSMTLTDDDHLATGGEATVYRKANLVIKIYLDPSRFSHSDMVAKLRHQASALQHPGIVAPKGLVTDTRKRLVGYYMSFIDGEPLPRLFSNDFRARNSFGDEEAKLLVAEMFDVVDFAHQRNYITIDLNELNWTTVSANAAARSPRALDVDSWVPESNIPLRVPMMPSIYDFYTSQFGRETDWFALAVVSFQVFAGIHPYKGGLDGYKLNDLESRMRDNKSVFEPGIRLNGAVRDFSCIPAPLLNWYYETFVGRERTQPPSPFDTSYKASHTIRTGRVRVTATSTLKYDRLLSRVGDLATNIYSCGVVRLQSGELVDLSSGNVIGYASVDAEVVRKEGGWLIADPRNHSFMFVHGSTYAATHLKLTLNWNSLVRSNNRLFAVTENGLTELELHLFARPLLAVGRTWAAMPNATRWFDGVGIQDAFGATYVFAPFGENSCAQIRVRELDGIRPLAAKAGRRFVAIMCADKQGGYRKVEITFDHDYQTYVVRQEHADTPELNMALLPRGVTATIVQDGELLVYVPTSLDPATPGSLNMTRVPDRDITTTMILGNWDDRVVFIRDGQVWSVKMT